MSKKSTVRKPEWVIQSHGPNKGWALIVLPRGRVLSQGAKEAILAATLQWPTYLPKMSGESAPKGDPSGKNYYRMYSSQVNYQAIEDILDGDGSIVTREEGAG